MTGGWAKIDQQRRADMWSPREMLCLWGFTMWNITTHPYQTSRGFLQQLSLVFSVLSLTVSFSPTLPFCHLLFSCHICPLLSGMEGDSKCFSIYSEVEVLLLCWNFTSQTIWYKNSKSYKILWKAWLAPPSALRQLIQFDSMSPHSTFISI